MDSGCHERSLCTTCIRGPCPEPPLLLPAGFGPDEIGPRVQEQALSSARIWVRVFSESIRVFVKYAYFRSQILEI
jgi:hypothetical protein